MKQIPAAKLQHKQKSAGVMFDVLCFTWYVASSQAFSKARLTMVFCRARPM